MKIEKIMIQLLISPNNLEEAKDSILGGADIIDVKNPKEGSLGANFPWVINEIQKLVRKHNGIKVSATIGDFPNLPGSAALAALGLATCNVDYIKVGLKGPKTKQDAIYLMKKVCRAVNEYNKNIKIVVAGYADYERFGTINPLLIPEITKESGANVAMVDTGIKDGKSLFDFMTREHIQLFIETSWKNNLLVALAGSLRKSHIPDLNNIHPDIIGLRGAVCEKADRINGRIKPELIKEIKSLLQ